MNKRVLIRIGALTLEGELNDTKVAGMIYDALPITASGSHWGDEIYFEIPVVAENENPQEEVEVGQLAYWPPGQAFCIFFGKTPASTTDKPRAASPVTVVGQLRATPSGLSQQLSVGEVCIDAVPPLDR